MEHRRPDHAAPGGGPTAGERARAAGTADPGPAGDTHVAGSRHGPPAEKAPEPVHGTAPDPVPAARAPAPAAARAPAKLFDPGESGRFRERWRDVQSAFVDDPGEAVRRADLLASEAVDALGRAIAEHRRTLSEALEKHERADTEQLRLALRGYRDLLDRIFAA